MSLGFAPLIHIRIYVVKIYSYAPADTELSSQRGMGLNYRPPKCNHWDASWMSLYNSHTSTHTARQSNIVQLGWSLFSGDQTQRSDALLRWRGSDPSGFSIRTQAYPAGWRIEIIIRASVETWDNKTSDWCIIIRKLLSFEKYVLVFISGQVYSKQFFLLFLLFVEPFSRTALYLC